MEVSGTTGDTKPPPNLILLLMFGSLTLFMLTGLPIAFVLGLSLIHI